MTREELWEEFENQLIRETRTSMTMNFDTAERMTKLGIKETVAKWKDRLEREPCEDAVSRKAVVEYIEGSDAELGHSSENELVCQDILNMPSVKPVACIATIKFSKEDMQELVNEKMKEIVVERKKGKWVTKFHGFPPELSTFCSECGFDRDYNIRPRYYHKIKFCPICGAEMESEE